MSPDHIASRVAALREIVDDEWPRAAHLHAALDRTPGFVAEIAEATLRWPRLYVDADMVECRWDAGQRVVSASVADRIEAYLHDRGTNVHRRVEFRADDPLAAFGVARLVAEAWS